MAGVDPSLHFYIMYDLDEEYTAPDDLPPTHLLPGGNGSGVRMEDRTGHYNLRIPPPTLPTPHVLDEEDMAPDDLPPTHLLPRGKGSGVKMEDRTGHYNL